AVGVFLVGHEDNEIEMMEVIDNDFYIYAKDINFVDISCFKRKIFDDSSFCGSTESVNSIRAKLLFTHRNVNENSKVISNIEESSSAVLIDCLASVEDDDESVESTNVFGCTENNYTKSARIGSSCDSFQEDKIDNKIK
ncbi:9390_t:CDS:2, partial [Racocetra persica]